MFLWIACLLACNSNDRTPVRGNLQNCKGKKVYFEICGQDTTITVALDSVGNFEINLPLREAGYVRLANGKAAFPLYLQPGEKVQVKMDVEKVQNGDYKSVELVEGNNPETRMMVDYYEKQWFPSTQEMFVLPPVDFKQMMDSIVRHLMKCYRKMILVSIRKYTDTRFTRFPIGIICWERSWLV